MVSIITMEFDPTVWGPHYWFFLHTIAYSYPNVPTSVTKRKYYDLIQNFPLFIPDSEISVHFEKMIDKYPVSPYLDNRDSFVRWVYFIHNKINNYLGKEEITLLESTDRYFAEYKPKPVYSFEKIRQNRDLIILAFVFIIIFIIFIYS